VPRRDVLGVPGTDRGMDYGGWAPAFNPLNNTLFLLSHVYDQKTAELTIPTLGTNPSSLPTAGVRTGFVDALEGHLQDVAAGQGALGGPVVVGNCCLSIISRTSYGPSLAATNPSLLTPGATTQATTLVNYPELHPTLGKWGATGANAYFNGSSQIKGVVFPVG